jgi:biopolymer transport protein ExbD
MAKHRRHGDPEGVNLALVITPFLDMSFQLLAFFIMVYHPSALEAHIDGKLLPPLKISRSGPSAADPKMEKEKKDKEPEKKDEVPIDKEPDAKEIVRVIIRAVPPGQKEGTKGEGEISRLQMRLPGQAEMESLTDAETSLSVGLQRLHKKLVSLLKGPGGDKLSLTIDTDPNLKYGYFIQVQDTCKSAKVSREDGRGVIEFQNIGFAAPIPLGQ